MEPYDFNRVSPTALIPAFARGEYTDIPWAKEMLLLLRERGRTLWDGPWNDRAVSGFASFFESRFKAVNRILEERGATQVLELAAGLSPRGMDLAQRGILYVEADLAESNALKREIVVAILGYVPERLVLSAASVLDRSEFRQCCAVFNEGPVAVTTEGLLRYLTFEEKTMLAANVHELLSRHGGIWVTTDIHLKRWLQRQGGSFNREKETERLGRDLEPNYFDDLDHARAFFEGCGFEVEPRPLLEGVRERMVSLHSASDELLAELTERKVFILRLAADRTG